MCNGPLGPPGGHSMAINGKQVANSLQAQCRLSRTVVYSKVLEQALFPGKAAKIVGVSFDTAQAALIFDIAGTDVPDSEWFNVEITNQPNGAREIKFIPVNRQ